MKNVSINIFIAILMLFLNNVKAHKEYNGLPMIKANSVQVNYRVGDDWYINAWNIAQHIESDSLFITCFLDGVEDFTFFTDIDSIALKIKPDQSHKFYVLLNDTTYALTVIKGVIPDFANLQFNDALNNEIKFWYEKNKDSEYLKLLRSKYPIEDLVRNLKSDKEKALAILNWVHNQWEHNGNNVPEKPDAISILDEAKQGKNFRCVEYGIVASACLNAIGIKTRIMGLKTKDVETRRYGAGHVVLEAYLDDLEKWAMLDGQWNAMPVLYNTPLNAVEFQKAITENYKDLKIMSLSNVSKRRYVEWIYPYLYYFDINFDNREKAMINPYSIKGKRSLMLVPAGAKNPEVFQIKYKLDHFIYTNSFKEFYSSPYQQMDLSIH